MFGDASTSTNSTVDLKPQLDEPRNDDGSKADDLDEVEKMEDDSSDCADDLEDAEEEASRALNLDSDGAENRESSRLSCWGLGLHC